MSASIYVQEGPEIYILNPIRPGSADYRVDNARATADLKPEDLGRFDNERNVVSSNGRVLARQHYDKTRDATVFRLTPAGASPA